MSSRFIAEMSMAQLNSVAFEIRIWPDLDDYFGLTNRLRDCGYALIDEERGARETRPPSEFISQTRPFGAVFARLMATRTPST